MTQASQTFRAPHPVLALHQVSVRLGSRRVLNDVSLTLQPGEILGLLGPNGSGKTTLFRCLLGLLLPGQGTCLLAGQEVSFGDSALRRAVGVVFQDPSLDRHLTARENLLLGARLFGVRGAVAKLRATELLSFFDLQARADERVDLFSGGMKRRLEIARALIGDPKILVLDEPTVGLDPPARDRVWKRLLALRDARGLSLLVATHSAEEAALTDRLMVLDRGQVVASNTPEGLLAQVAGDIVKIDSPSPEKLRSIFHDEMGLTPTVENNWVTLSVDDGARSVARLVEAAGAANIRQIQVSRPSLSTVFSSLTGRPLDALSSDEGAP